jgi:hypothetical protein
MNDSVHRKTIDLARGLFLVRYHGSNDPVHSPVVRVFPDQGHAQNCTILTAPDASDGSLYYPDGALVVSVSQPCRLIVEVSSLNPGGSSVASVKIDALTQGRVPDRSSRDPRADLRVTAHVAGIGDVTDRNNGWIAGPSAPARIEGLSLDWPGKPQDVTLRYAVRSARPQAGDNQFVPLGTFAGTRGRALPLTTVSIELSGPGASLYTLVAEAAFMGAPAMRMTGQRVGLSGPSGREPLVGIKLYLEKVSVQPVVTQVSAPVTPPPARPAVNQAPAPPPPRPASRVRVFRGRQGSEKPTG